MKRVLLLICASVCLLPVVSCWADTDSLFFFFDPYQDPLAPRDEYGVFHRTPRVNRTDFDPQHSLRVHYYFESGEKLVTDPAYVGALQTCLHNNGYYCGPIDGVFSDRVAEAITRVQKNYALQVTGTLTVGVRRALHLP